MNPKIPKNNCFMKTLLIGVFALLCSALGVRADVQADMSVVPADEFAHFVATVPGVQLLDVRTMAEYAQSHVPGAMLIDWRDPAFADEAAALLDPNQPVALYCLGGVRSHQAALALQARGFKHVVELQNGFKAWLAAGREVSPKSE